jgi:glycosyltransferase involved in cell wall biosynthesis
MEAYKIGFIIEQALGHVTHGKNLQVNVPKDNSVEAHWGLPAFETSGIASKIPVYKSNWTVRAGLRTRRLVAEMNKQTELDALFFHTQVTAVLATNWVKRIPSIVSLDATPLQYDSLGEFYEHEAGPTWLEKMKWRLNRDCYRAARHLVTWTAWTKQGLVDDYEVEADKVTVIPPGVNTSDWYRPTPRQLTYNHQPVKILFVGGNLERKGGLLLLEAFRTLRQSFAALDGAKAGIDVQLHLATRDQVPEEPGLFVYNDMQANSQPLKQLYHECDIFCLPTYGDCLPMVLSEAGAAGLPTVSTQLAGIPEIVREGETGFLVARGDVPALTQALRKLIDNPALRLQFGERAVQVVTDNFDAERNTFRLLDLIKHIVDEERKTS